MKRLLKKIFNKIFRKKSQLNYIIAEYHPTETNLLNLDTRFTEGKADELNNSDEKKIDKPETVKR